MTLQIEKLCFAYNSHDILENIDLTVLPGQILTILGPNGAGKTTLLRCINSIRTPRSGSILVDSHDVLRMNLSEIARTIGYVAQRSESAQLTVFDAVLMGRAPHIRWRASKDDMCKTEAVLQHTNLSDKILVPLDELSGGELQKVCIARALVQEPEILLLDEPTSSLDLKNQLDVLSLLLRIVRSHGITAVMTMHDINTALRFSDQLAFLRQGRIHTICPPQKVSKGIIQEVYGLSADILHHNGHYIIIPDSQPEMENL